jgi:alpha-L-fucosidase
LAKTKDKLQKLYLESVGANCALMLGVPPMKDGSFAEMDYQILMAFGKTQKQTYNYKVSGIAEISASSSLSPEYDIKNLVDADENKTWKPAKDDLEPEIIFTFKEKDMFDRVLMMENIKNGQHVEEYEIYLDTGDGKFKRIDKGGIVGYKRIHKIAPTEVQRVKIKITSYRGELELQEVTLY